MNLDGFITVGCLPSFAVLVRMLDAGCTRDREQELHGEGRTMESPLAFLFAPCLYRGMAQQSPYCSNIHQHEDIQSITRSRAKQSRPGHRMFGRGER